MRLESPGAVYHVMNRRACAVARQAGGRSCRKTVLGKADDEECLRTLSETHELWGVEVFVYGMMDIPYMGKGSSLGGTTRREVRPEVDEVLQEVCGKHTKRNSEDSSLNSWAGDPGIEHSVP